MPHLLTRLSIVCAITAACVAALAVLVTQPAAAAPLAPSAPLAPEATGIYVTASACPPDSFENGTKALPFCRIQDAINAAPTNGEIRVAGGLYTYTRVMSTGMDVYTYTQVALITRSVKLRGSWNADWTVQSITLTPSTINPLGKGRGITIRGVSSPEVSVDDFIITGGDYTGLGNPPGVATVCPGSELDCGGGLYAHYGKLLASDLVISGNVAARSTSGRTGFGGGAFLWAVAAGSRIERSSFVNNLSGWLNSLGGGMYAESVVGLVITGSGFISNTADDGGAGLFLFHPSGLVAITNTVFYTNYTWSTNFGGGGLGAKLTLDGVALQASRLRFSGNYGTNNGAAIMLEKQGSGVSRVKIDNTLIDNNRDANDKISSAIYVDYGHSFDVALDHITAADNRSDAFLRVHSAYAGSAVTVTLRNTLVHSAQVAYAGEQNAGEAPALIRHTNTLTDGVGALHADITGTTTFEAINPLGGDPRLDSSYHLQAGSAAIDQGVATGVTDDIDGDSRTVNAPPDIGADEYRKFFTYLPLARRT